MKTQTVFGIMALALSIVFFVLGVYFPILTTKTQVLGIRLQSQDVNLFDSIMLFFKSKDYLIAAIILIFTFILPISKYIELIIRLFTNKTNHIMQHLDKWNMLDVFLVALLLLNFKMNSTFIVMELKIGTTFIAFAVIFRILAIILITNYKQNKACEKH